MATERAQKVDTIYHAARNQEPGQRAAFLREACGGDESLLREVKSLLAQGDGGEDFLQAPAIQLAAELFCEDFPALLVGQQLGTYRILEQIGAGGMGEVYRAHDSELGREVAIKVLPKVFSADAERLRRFRREAQLLASLNHPNIAIIHRLVETTEMHFLVLELVPGETLAERLQAGPLDVREALRICSQVAEALEAAHQKGITHRDIKPANIKVTPEGKVKVLDFGLAKAFTSEKASTQIPNLPSAGRTEKGQILGTPAYMSPEQARGQDVDKQSDIWAFGCLLYELLTGVRAFQGATFTDTIGAILHVEPNWDLLPPAVSPDICILLQRCLQKEKTHRLHDIADARLEIEDALGARSAKHSRVRFSRRFTRKRVLGATVASVIMAVTLILLSIRDRSSLPLHSVPQPHVSRFSYVLPPGERLTMLAGLALAIAPDGQRFVYVASTEGTRSHLYLRSIDSLDARPIIGTDGADTPFFSPDGQWVGFWAGRMQKISINGGAPIAMARWENTNGGATWGPNDTVLYPLSNRSVIYRLPGAGGNPEPVTALEGEGGSHRWPEMLPGGQAVLYTNWSGTADTSQIVVRRLETKEQRVLVQGATFPRYVPTGHLVFAKAGNLMAVPFDPERLEMKGTPVQVVEGVMQSIQGASQYAFSGDGTLIYIPGGMWVDPGYLVSVDRQGKEELLQAPPRPYLQLDLSPDGKKAALLIQQGKMNIWVYDIPQNRLTQLTEDGTETSPVWSVDGSKVAFGKTMGGRRNLFWRPGAGTGTLEQLTTSAFFYQPGSFSPDGLAAYNELHPETGRDIYVAALTGDRKSRPLLQGPYDESVGTFSPDGRHIAYVSNETGRFEIFVQDYPGPGGKWQISTEGGEQPLWNPNGRELFYRIGDNTMAVEITPYPVFRAGKPKLLFTGRYKKQPGPGTNFGVTPDGQRFIMIKPGDQEPSATQIDIVLNWFEELKQRIPTGQP